jgi:hypothetical protein
MRSILPVLCLLVLAVPGAGAQDEIERPVTKPPSNWDTLIAQYRRHGLPELPTDAELVLASRGRVIPGVRLAFAQDGERTKLLIGTESISSSSFDEVVTADPNEVRSDQLQVGLYSRPFGINALLASAVQCRIRGWNRLADALFVRATSEACGHPNSQYYQPEAEPADLALARVAWAHYGNQLTAPDSDRKSVLTRMERLWDEFPKFHTAPNRLMFKCLRAALKPTGSSPGSAEAEIDALVDFSGDFMVWYPMTSPSRVSSLTMRGFEAIPALLEHLDDPRLTRAHSGGLNNFPPQHLRVGDIVQAVLGNLATVPLGREGRPWRLSFSVDPKLAKAWWKRAKPFGEERWVVEHVLPPRPETSEPRGDLLQILAARYPNRLPYLYRVILRARPDIDSGAIASAIAASTLLPTQKRSLLIEAIEQSKHQHRRAALSELRSIDEPEFTSRMLAIAEGLPPLPEESYSRSPEAGYASLASSSPDPRIWKALLVATQRADVPMRMEYLSAIGHYHRREAPTYRLALSLLAAFLDDASPRQYTQHPRKLGDSVVEQRFDQLEVRNLAAYRAGWLLRIRTMPLPEWDTERWARYRAEVEAALKQAGIFPAAR